MLGSFAIISWIIILIVYFILTVSIFYHFKKYAMSGSQRRAFLGAFTIISLILFITNLIIYSQIPWNEISDIISTGVRELGGS